MKFIVYLQKLTLLLIWCFCAGAFAAITAFGFQKSTWWGVASLLIGLLFALILFKVSKVIHKLLFGMIYAAITPKELKNAMRNTRESKNKTLLFGGGDGLTPESAVTCDCSSLAMASSLAHSYIKEECGADSTISMQYTMADSRELRVYCVAMPDGTEVKFYFDFSSQRQRASEIQNNSGNNR